MNEPSRRGFFGMLAAAVAAPVVAPLKVECLGEAVSASFVSYDSSPRFYDTWTAPSQEFLDKPLLVTQSCQPAFANWCVCSCNACIAAGYQPTWYAVGIPQEGLKRQHD